MLLANVICITEPSHGLDPSHFESVREHVYSGVELSLYSQSGMWTNVSPSVPQLTGQTSTGGVLRRQTQSVRVPMFVAMNVMTIVAALP